LVYHLSTKLKNDAIHNRIGQAEEVKLIHFLTRYGYATRAAPLCKLYGAYGKHTNIQNVNYINNFASTVYSSKKVLHNQDNMVS
jgi:hypothetical protein